MRQPHVVLGVCGGVSSFKAVALARLLRKAEIRVSVIMTANAHRFIGAHTFAALTDEPVRTSLWDSPEPSPHTTLGQGADLIAVMPATARLIGAVANGLCDDLLTNTIAASKAPLLIAPAMHTEMWGNPAVADNVARLKQRGTHIIGPDDGLLAGGDSGVGRLVEPDAIFDEIQRVLNNSNPTDSHQDLKGVRFLVTAGGTREPIDPVRFIGNRSSGKQGSAIALDAQSRGADVHLITTVEPPAGIDHTRVSTADEMHKACVERISNCDVLVMAAAVADFRPTEVASQKIKKGNGTPAIELVPTVDILSEISSLVKPGQVVVGFAAETSEDAEAHAKSKLKRKKLDAVVLNDVSRSNSGFEVDVNAISMFLANGQVTHCEGEKRTVAHHINSEIAQMISKR